MNTTTEYTPKGIESSKISIFDNAYATQPTGTVNISDALDSIKNGKYRKEIESVRALYKHYLESGDKSKYNGLKKTLPALSLSGTFTQRNDDSIIQHSGFLQIDVDSISNQAELEKTREILKNTSFIYTVFLSPSEHALKALAKIDPQEHTESFLQLEEYFQKRGIIIDTSCKNPSRLCFVSYDPELWINENATVFNVSKTRKTERRKKPASSIYNNRFSSEILDDVYEALEYIPVKYDGDGRYSEFIQLTFALRDKFSESEVISLLGNKIASGNIQPLEQALRSYQPGRISIGSFFEIAKRYGYTRKLKQYTQAKKLETKSTDTIIRYSERYFRQFELTNKLTALIAPPGAGKTTQVLPIREKYSEYTWINFSHLVSLALKLSSQFDAKFYQEVNLDICNSDLSIVINSLYKCNALPEKFILFWDEVTQGMKALFNKLNKDKRLEIFEKLNIFLEKASYVIISDADLDNDTIEFFREKTGSKNITLIENNYKNGAGKTIYINSQKAALRKTHLQGIQEKTPHTYFSDSLKEIQKISRLDLDRGIIITSETSGTEEIRDVIKNLNAKSENYDSFIYTPSFSTGNDLNDSRFKTVFCNITSNTLSIGDYFQGIGRARKAEDIHVYINPRNDFLETNWKNIYTQYTEKNPKTLNEYVRIVFKDGIPTVNDKHLDYLKLKCRYEAAANIEKSNQKELFIIEARNRGYNVVLVEEHNDDDLKTTRELFSALTEQTILDKVDRIKNASLISDEKYFLLSQKYTIDKIDRAELEKYEFNTLGIRTNSKTALDKTIRTFHTPEKIMKALNTRLLIDDDVKIETLILRDKQNIEKNWLGDYQGTAEKRAFIKLIIMETKIDRWGRNQFNKESIEVINFQAFLLKHKNDAKRILNISVNDNENSRIILVRNFLKLIGIKLICKKNALDVRQYSVDLLLELIVERAFRHIKKLETINQKIHVSPPPKNIDWTVFEKTLYIERAKNTVNDNVKIAV